VLVRTPQTDQRIALLPVRLEVLEVEFNVECVISRTGLPEERGNFAVIVCLSDDPALIDYFLRSSAAMLAALGETPSNRSVAESVQQFVRLFRALSAIPRNTVQGLWAELFLIGEGRGSDVLAESWHISPDERYDFSIASNRIEVKSSGRRDRRHHFSLEQLEPPPGVSLLIASIHLERSSGGLSLGELIEEASGRVSIELGNRVREVVAETLGNTFQASLDVAFDRELARSSIRYCWSYAVPRIARPLPDYVSDVKFIADLACVEWISGNEFASVELFAALPTRAGI